MEGTCKENYCLMIQTMRKHLMVSHWFISYITTCLIGTVPVFLGNAGDSVLSQSGKPWLCPQEGPPLSVLLLGSSEMELVRCPFLDLYFFGAYYFLVQSWGVWEWP